MRSLAFRSALRLALPIAAALAPACHDASDPGQTTDSSASASESGESSSSTSSTTSSTTGDTSEVADTSTTTASTATTSTSTSTQDTDPSTFDPSDSLSESTDDMTYPVETFDTTAALPIKKVVASEIRTIVLDAMGRVFVWGLANNYLGVGPIPHKYPCGFPDENGDLYRFCWPHPVALPEIESASDLAAVPLPCAIFPDGTRTCWGDLNSWHAEGDEISLELPTPMPELTGIVGTASAGLSRCIWDAQGAVTCWGDTLLGQCGDGVYESGFAPRGQPLAGLPAADRIMGASLRYFLLTPNGDVWSWGNNSQYYLGHPTDDSIACNETVDEIICVPTPRQVAEVSNVVSLNAGPATCIATRSGEAYCWGWNRDGELGQGTCNTPSTHLPQKIPGITDASLIAGNPETTCVVHQAGKKLSCWGKFLAAHISEDEEIKKQCNGYVPYPVDIPLADHIEQITFGNEHVCLIGELEGYKGVMCYGSNRYYELGCSADFIYCPGREKNPVTGEFSARKVVQNLARSFEREENETR